MVLGEIKNAVLPRIFFLVFTMIATTAAPAVLAQPYSIIVNVTNNYAASDDEMRQLIKRLFLKQETDWPNGELARAFGRDPKSSEQNVFAEKILAMNTAEIARHWLGLKQKTGETPPRSINSTRMLLKTVEKYPGAFGLVDEKTAKELPNTVKILFSF